MSDRGHRKRRASATQRIHGIIRPMRPFALSLLICLLLLMPTAQMRADVSSAYAAESGSGTVTDTWAERSERVASFGSQWSSFAPIHASWMTKWQKAHDKLASHIQRCNVDVRSANRDTLLPVTLQCYRSQLIMERDALRQEQDIIRQWPGLPDAQRSAMQESGDALLNALQPVVDAIDAKVFSTFDMFRNVRSNLLTQYRKPYWLAAARVRASGAMTWLDFMLISLREVREDASLSAEELKETEEVMECYEHAAALLLAAQNADSLETSHAHFSEAVARADTCSTLLAHTQHLQYASSVSSSR